MFNLVKDSSFPKHAFNMNANDEKVSSLGFYGLEETEMTE